MTLSTLDLVALGWFLAAWLGYSLVIDRSPRGKDSLTALVAAERRRWMETMAIREHRIVDAALIGGLQQGTAFFASTSLLAIGGALTLLRSAEEMIALSHALPFAVETTRELWQAKVLGLAVILTYAFFKFAWAYRLFNYTAILIGATPIAYRDEPPEAPAFAQARKAAAMQSVAAADFNRGMRAFFFALGYLGWLLSPIALFATTSAVVIVLYRRQFASPAVGAITPCGHDEDAAAS
jgi:uncharacterized membrane protein